MKSGSSSLRYRGVYWPVMSGLEAPGLRLRRRTRTWVDEGRASTAVAA